MVGRVAVADIKNFVRIDDRLATAGQPTEAQVRDVAAVLAQLDIDADAGDRRVMEAWNKADRLSDAGRAEAMRAIGGAKERRPVLVSAQTMRS